MQLYVIQLTKIEILSKIQFKHGSGLFRVQFKQVALYTNCKVHVIKFVSDLWQVGGFLRVLRLPPPKKKTDHHDIAIYIVESGIQHHITIN